MNSKALPIAVVGAAILIFAGNYYVSLGAECGRPTEPCKCRVRLVGAKQWGAAAASCSVKLAFAPDFASSDLVDCDTVEPGTFDRVVMCDPGVKATLYCGDSTVSVPAGGNVRLTCKSDARNRDRLWVNGKDTWVNTVQVPSAAYIVEQGTPREAEFLTDSVRVRVIDGAAGLERGASSSEQMLLVASGEAEMESLCTGETVRVKGPGTAGVPRPAERFDFCSFQPLPDEPPECSRLDVVGRWRGVYALQQRGQPRRTVSFVLNIRSESGRLAGTLETPAATFPIAEAQLSGSSLTLRAASDRYGQVNLDGQVARGDITLNVTHRDTTVSPAVGLSGVGSAGRLYIASVALPPAAVGQPYSYELVALSPSRAAITYRLAEGSLPAGLTLEEGTGVFSGTATAAGESSFVVRATDARGDTADQRFTLAVKKLAITTTLLPEGFAGQRYSTTLQAAGGRPPYRWENQLPHPGFQLDASTGTLSVEGGERSQGLPLCVSVTDQDGNTAQQSLTVTLRGLTIVTSHFLPEAVVGVPYRTRFQAAGASSPVSWEADALGNGLQFNPQTGELSGTPTQAGAILFGVTAEAGGRTEFREFLLQVSPPGAAAGPPRIAANGIVNGASFAAGAAVAPGSIISVFGSDLAPLPESAAATPLPTTLGGASLTINNRQAPLFFVSPTQINAQLPFEISPGTATAVVTKLGQASVPASFSVAAAGPGILTFGTNRAVAQNQDYSINNTNNPARAGSVVTVYVTGQGQVDNPVATGAPAPASPLARARLPVTATIGGRSAEVLFAGLTPGYVGLLQVNLRVPELSPGDYPLAVTIGGVASNSAMLTVSAN